MSRIGKLPSIRVKLKNRSEVKPKVSVDSKKVNLLFRALRKQGVWAKRRVACCESCAHEQIRQKVRMGTSVVFSHKQGEEDVREGRILHLHYGINTSSGVPEDTEKIRSLGQLVADRAKEFGLSVVWDGSPDTCVKIVPEEAPRG